MRIKTILAGGLAAAALTAGLIAGPMTPAPSASASPWNQPSCSSMPQTAKFWIALPWHWQVGVLDHIDSHTSFSLASGRYREAHYYANGQDIGTKGCD